MKNIFPQHLCRCELKTNASEMLHLISGKDESEKKDGKGPKSGEYSTTKVNVAKEHKNQQ